MLENLGYVEPPGDQAWMFFTDFAQLYHIQDNDDSEDRWERLRDERPAPMGLWYRSSPRLLVLRGMGKDGWSAPPRYSPGMISLKLDPSGRLRYLSAIPGYLDDLRPGEGRFRSFLLSAMKYHISKQRAPDRAEKRGGGRPLLPLDIDQAEHRYRLEPVDDWTLEKAYERSWALTVLDRVEGRLARELGSQGKAEVHRQLGPAIFGRKPPRTHRDGSDRGCGQNDGAAPAPSLRQTAA
jgi:hypothetical protein